jgi:Xaa-Pro aminopeptidase
MQFKPLSRESYISHRKRLAESLHQDSIAILHSNDRMPLSADQFFPFRQNKDLLRLCGIYQEETTLLLYPDHPIESNREILFIKKADDYHKTWDGELLDKKKAEEISGIKNIQWFEDFVNIAYSLIPRAEHIYVNSNEKGYFPVEVEGRNERLGKKLITQFPFHNIKRLQPILREHSLIKTADEINQIRKAIKLTGETWHHLLPLIKQGVYEYEIAAEISYLFERKGAIHAFQPIVASGKSACTLHYKQNSNLILKDDLVLVDFGAELNGYAADMTRCKAADGIMSKRQFAVYDQVLSIFTEAKKIIKPGITIQDINDNLLEVIWQSILELGLGTNANDKKNSVRKYMPHGVSHFLGMDVHDYGDKHTVLGPGMVITCEPGIYINEEGIGIRLENDLLITEGGNEDLMEGIDM